MKYILLLIVLLTAPAFATYAPEEMCVIPWGDSTNQIKIEQPGYDESEGGYQYLIPGGGPQEALVDMGNNIYVISKSLEYFKAFDKTGREILNLDTEYNSNGDSIPLRPISNFYVDSKSNIYLECSNPISTDILVLDKNGTLIDRLNPCQEGTGGNTALLEGFGYDDLISIGCEYGWHYTYYNHEIKEGGSGAYKARDGYYYYAYPTRDDQIKFSKFRNASITGKPDSLYEKIIPMDSSMKSCEFLGVDDSMNIFLKVYKVTSNRAESGVRIYNTKYEVIDEFWFDPAKENRYLMRINSPSFRRDGSIYEFRCLDDGLHVIRWSRK
jgi:hypothetical protein